MAPYKIIVAYDGTRYSGFQKQNNSRTIQGELESALRKLGWCEDSIKFSGRTDAGVHADGQTVVFNLKWQHTKMDLINALNANLPTDISIAKADIAIDNFHPRFNAKMRVYRYQIYQSHIRNSLLDRFHWRIWPKTNIEVMNDTAQVLVDTHDFWQFGKPPNEKTTTVRTINRISWEDMGDGILYFRISAEAFLYHMVRRIVFLSVKIGQGSLKKAILAQALENQVELPAGIAPANGLFFETTEY